MAIFAAFRVQQAIALDNIRRGIRKHRKCVTLRLTQLARVFRRIDADGRDLDVALIELVQVMLETPQLGVAEGSPIASIEDQHNSAIVLQLIGQADLFSIPVREGKVGCGLPYADGLDRSRDSFRDIENYKAKKDE